MQSLEDIVSEQTQVVARKSRPNRKKLSQKIEKQIKIKKQTKEEKELIRAIAQYREELQNLDKEFSNWKEDHRKQKEALETEIQEKTAVLNSKTVLLYCQRELLHNLEYESRTINTVLSMYRNRQENNQRNANEIKINIDTILINLEKVESEFQVYNSQLTESNQKFQKYTEKYLKIKSEMMFFIRKNEEKSRLAGVSGIAEDIKNDLQMVSKVKNLTKSLLMCPICYCDMKDPLVCSNNHSICNVCCERLEKCPFCSVKLENLKKNRHLIELRETIIQK